MLRECTTKIIFAEPGTKKRSFPEVKERWMEKRSTQGRENHPYEDKEKPKESSQSSSGDWQIKTFKQANVRLGPWMPS